MPYKRGDVVLIPFPFAERLGAKKRPAVVVSSNTYNTSCPDVVVAQITSRMDPAPRPGDHRVRDWRAAGLVSPSLVRARLVTLQGSIVIRRLGAMPDRDMAAVDRGLAGALAL
jgi:mRNA interferase MazF